MAEREKKTAELKLVAKNRKAFHDYEIQERFEAGISLLGSEVKSVRDGRINISDAYAAPDGTGLMLKNLDISPWAAAGSESHEPLRQRRLLLHKREIRKIIQLVSEKGLTIVPLAVYFKGQKIKIELGVARGRRKRDKRQEIERKESDRIIRRESKRET